MRQQNDADTVDTLTQIDEKIVELKDTEKSVRRSTIKVLDDIALLRIKIRQLERIVNTTRKQS